MSRELFNSYRRSRMRKFEAGGDTDPLVKEYKDLSEQYVKEKQRWEASNSNTGDLGEDMEDGWYDKVYAMRKKLWDLSAEVEAEEQSKPNSYKGKDGLWVSRNERDIKGGGTFKYISDMWGDSITPIWIPEEREPEKILKIDPIELQELSVDMEELELQKALDYEAPKPLREKVKDVSFSYSNYGREDDAGVMDKHGRYFTLTLKDGSTMRLAPETYRNYFGTQSLINPGKELKVFKKYGGTINPALINMHRHNYGGHVNWNKRAKAEYGKTVEQPVDERALRDNVSLIQPTQVDSVSPPPLTVDTVEQELNTPVEEKVTNLTVNKHGWADLEAYRKKKDDTDFIMGTQDFLIENGWKGSNDGAFGNKTYAGMNEYLTNRKLDEYSSDNFTEDQFYDQIYKESHGKNDKVSPRGAIGLAQFMPSTFTWAKEKGWIPETAKISDPAAQSLAQRKYMDHLYNDIAVVKSAGTDREERQARAFASYNHGPDNFKNFWEGLTTKQKDEGWKTWYKEANDETQKYVLWMMDKAEYKRLYNTPETRTRKDGTTFKTSKWNDVYYGYESWRSKNHSYRY
jgi:hypothetical protein